MSYPFNAPTILTGNPIPNSEVDLTWSAAPDASTLLLLHFDGADGSNTFVDSSSYHRTVYNDGNPVMKTAAAKYGTTGAQFGATSQDSVHVANAPEFNFNQDWTIEFWINVQNNAISRILFTKSFYTSLNPAQIDLSSAHIRLICADNTGVGVVSISDPSILNDALWHHFAFVRQGNVYSMYRDGVMVNTASSGTPLATNTDNIPVGQSSVRTYMVDFRLSARAVYTSNFTPPAQALPDSSTPDSYILQRDAVTRATLNALAYADMDTFMQGQTYNYRVAAATFNGVSYDQASDWSALFPVTFPSLPLVEFYAKYAPARAFPPVFLANVGSINPTIYRPGDNTMIKTHI